MSSIQQKINIKSLWKCMNWFSIKIKIISKLSTIINYSFTQKIQKINNFCKSLKDKKNKIERLQSNFKIQQNNIKNSNRALQNPYLSHINSSNNLVSKHT